MKKVGYFFLGFVPILIAVALEFIASFFAMGMSALFSLIPGVNPDKFSSGELRLFWLDTDFNACIMICFSISCIVVFGIWYYQTCGGNYRPGKDKFNVQKVSGTVLLAPGMQFITTIVIAMIYAAIPALIDQYNDLMESAGMDENITPFLLIYSVCLAPISEELIFRGVTMRVFRRALPFWIANLFQAILFGVFHMNWVQGIYAGCLGFLLGYVCEKGGSIYYSMLLHFVFNFFGTVISTPLSKLPDILILGIYGLMFLCFVFGLILFIMGSQKKQPRIS